MPSSASAGSFHHAARCWLLPVPILSAREDYRGAVRTGAAARHGLILSLHLRGQRAVRGEKSHASQCAADAEHAWFLIAPPGQPARTEAAPRGAWRCAPPPGAFLAGVRTAGPRFHSDSSELWSVRYRDQNPGQRAPEPAWGRRGKTS